MLFAIAIVISTVSAVDLVDNGFDNEHFAIDVPSSSNFSEIATTEINSGDLAMVMVVFENLGNDSDNVGAIIYLNDLSDDNKVISDFINDLIKNGEVVEETDKYVVVKTQNSNGSDFMNFDIANDFDSILSFVEGLFSSNGGINISSDEGNVSFSSNGLIVSDANGENVSITSQGIEISGSNGTDESNDTYIDVDENIFPDFPNGDYSVYLKNDTQMIVISGNNLELLKSMAESVSLKGN